MYLVHKKQESAINTKFKQLDIKKQCCVTVSFSHCKLTVLNSIDTKNGESLPAHNMQKVHKLQQRQPKQRFPLLPTYQTP